MFSGEEVEKIDKSDRLQKLMTEYKNLIFSICLKMSGDYFTAEDLTQETFLSVYEHLDSFDGRNEKAWICRIASNLCIDYRRQAARRMIPTSEEEMPPMTTEEEPLGMYLNREVIPSFERGAILIRAPITEKAKKRNSRPQRNRQSFFTARQQARI